MYYNFSSSLKYSYLNLKNSYAKDNKYLAVITENGIWIKEKTSTNNYVVKAENLSGNNLINITIYEFDNDLQPMNHYYLGDPEDIANRTNAVANQAKKKN